MCNEVVAVNNESESRLLMLRMRIAEGPHRCPEAGEARAGTILRHQGARVS